MDMKIRHASVDRVSAIHGGQVEVETHFTDGGTQVTNAKQYTLVFVTSSRTQPKVGSSVYFAIGELPPQKSPLQALKDDLAKEKT
jgi:hypothetical protein